MTFRPNKPAEAATSDEVRRVAVISEFDRIDPAPDQLCLLKRLVDLFDQLEVSDEVSWADAVAAITTSKFRRMFQGSTMDRQRYRYAVYGWDNAMQVLVFDELTAALP